MKLLAQILAVSLGLTILPRATEIMAKYSLLDGNTSGCAMNVVAVPSVSMETSSCTDASTRSFFVATVAGVLLTCTSACWTAWVTATDIIADRAWTSTVMRFGEGGVLMDSAVSSASSEALCLLVFDWEVGVERFLGGIVFYFTTLSLALIVK